MRVVCAVVVTMVLCLAAVEAEERTKVVHLSKSNHVTFTLTFPETCASKKLVILDHAGREVLQWASPCSTEVHQDYKDRVRLSCDAPSCQLQLTLLRLTLADSGTLQCRDGSLAGAVLPGCSLQLQVIASVHEHSGDSAGETRDSAGETRDMIIMISVILGVFLLVFLAGIDIIYKAICQRGGRASTESTDASSESRESEE